MLINHNNTNGLRRNIADEEERVRESVCERERERQWEREGKIVCGRERERKNNKMKNRVSDSMIHRSKKEIK
jgi:hypothetical protein